MGDSINSKLYYNYRTAVSVSSSLPNVILPSVTVKGPSTEPNIKLCSRFELFRFGLELIYIPVCPQELVPQESRLGTCEPNVETGGQRNYTKSASWHSVVSNCYAHRYLRSRQL
jgi:hypothetical protein